jgi:hypothetical protein
MPVLPRFLFLLKYLLIILPRFPFLLKYLSINFNLSFIFDAPFFEYRGRMFGFIECFQELGIFHRSNSKPSNAGPLIALFKLFFSFLFPSPLLSRLYSRQEREPRWRCM